MTDNQRCRHEESLYGRCTACGMTWEQQAEPAATQSIPESWDLITAGDGRTFESITAVTGYRWRPMGAGRSARHFTTAEILALGPVRRAVVVTLPDGWHPDHVKRLIGWELQKVAAALHAEDADAASQHRQLAAEVDASIADYDRKMENDFNSLDDEGVLDDLANDYRGVADTAQGRGDRP